MCEEEKQSKATLHSDVAAVVKNKSLLVFREILQETGYADQGVFEELVSGTQLTGSVPVTNVFDKRIKAALTSADALKSQASLINKSVLGSVRSQSEELDRALDQRTAEELGKG